MKTFLKMIIAVAAFGFATANAEYTTSQAAAIKAVADAVAKGNKNDVKAIVSQKVAEFPEIASDIVMAAINVKGVSRALKTLIVETAAFTLPDKLYLIVALFEVSGGESGTSSYLITAAQRGAAAGSRTQNQLPFIIRPVPAVS